MPRAVTPPRAGSGEAIDKKQRVHKSVAIIALGCFHPVTKVQSASLHFFLGSDKESEDSDESDDDVCSCLTK